MKRDSRSWLTPNLTTRHVVTMACVVVASLAVCGQAAAQITPPISTPPTVLEPPPQSYPPTVAPSAAGPYFPRPAWDQTLPPNVRFVVLTNFNNDAVLDRETGVVWARRNFTRAGGEAALDWFDADAVCATLIVGTRGGWRLPAASELHALIDFAAAATPGQPLLPAGHPFQLTGLAVQFASEDPFLFWTSDIRYDIASGNQDLLVPIVSKVSLTKGARTALTAETSIFPEHFASAWCVRGGP